MPLEFEPYSHVHKRDPYPIYRELRDRAPVHHAPGSGAWVLSRYDDVQWVLRTPEVFSSRTMRPGGPVGAAKPSSLQVLRLAIRFFAHVRASPRTVAASRMLINEDGDVHAGMRDLVNRGFTPRRIAAWEPRIREIVAGCMRRLGERRDIDLMKEVAIPLPVTVIAEMLGVEPERGADFKRWSDAVIQGGTGSGIADLSRSGLFAAMGELRRYLRPLVRARRGAPGDDLLSVLVGAEHGEVGLSEFEVFMFVLLLLIAGNETTTNLLGNAVDALLAHPDQLARVNGDPSRVPALVEETLRWDTPVQFLTRIAKTDVERHGVRIPRGAAVVALLGSANRDERHFPDPDRFDVDRDARGHLAFGFGNHFCLGASLARLEARLALEAIAPALRGLVRARPEVEFLDSYLIRGRSRLELRAA
jgi:cytochrome P450